PRGVRGPPRRPRRGGPAHLRRAAAPAARAVRARTHEALERAGGPGRRVRLRDARVQPLLRRGAEERARLPEPRVARKAGRRPLVRRRLGGHAGAGGLTAGAGGAGYAHRADRRERAVRVAVARRGRPVRARRGDGEGRPGDAGRAGAVDGGDDDAAADRRGRGLTGPSHSTSTPTAASSPRASGSDTRMPRRALSSGEIT